MFSRFFRWRWGIHGSPESRLGPPEEVIGRKQENKDPVLMFKMGDISVEELEEQLRIKLQSKYSGLLELAAALHKEVAYLWALRIKNSFSPNPPTSVSHLSPEELLIIKEAKSEKNERELRQHFIGNGYAPLDAQRMANTVVALRGLEKV